MCFILGAGVLGAFLAYQKKVKHSFFHIIAQKAPYVTTNPRPFRIPSPFQKIQAMHQSLMYIIMFGL